MTVRQQLETAIIEIHDGLKKHVINAGIKDEAWTRVTRNMDKWSDARIRYIHAFLINLRDNEWMEVHLVWTKPHVNEEMWENYEWMFDGKDVLEEQKLLTRARKKLRARFTQFKKDYKSFREQERNAAKKIAAEERAGGNPTGAMDGIS